MDSDLIVVKSSDLEPQVDGDMRRCDTKFLNTYLRISIDTESYESKYDLPSGLQKGTVGLFQANGHEKEALDIINSKIGD